MRSCRDRLHLFRVAFVRLAVTLWLAALGILSITPVSKIAHDFGAAIALCHALVEILTVMSSGLACKPVASVGRPLLAYISSRKLTSD